MADPRQQYPDEAFIEAVASNEPAGTRVVGEAVGCSRRNADIRLRQLEDGGRVRNKMVGNSLVWFLES